MARRKREEDARGDVTREQVVPRASDFRCMKCSGSGCRHGQHSISNQMMAGSIQLSTQRLACICAVWHAITRTRVGTSSLPLLLEKPPPPDLLLAAELIDKVGLVASNP